VEQTPESMSEEDRRALDDLRARDQLDVLLLASKVLSQHDEQDPAKDLPALIVPAVGDWCSVDLVDGDGLRRVAAHHVDPAQAAREPLLREQHPGWAEGAAEVIRTGMPSLAFDVRERLAEGGADQHAVLAGIGMVSVAMVPVRTPERVLGVLTVATGPDRRGPRPSDVAAFDELANRVAFALERVEVHETLLAARRQTAELEGARRIAHDFGNLLTRIVGYAELAERRLLAGELATEEVAEIRAAAEAAVRLTRAPAQGELIEDGWSGTADAGELATALGPTLRALVGGDRLRIVELGPAPVAMAPSSVQHVLRNLVANAGHASAEGKGGVAVQVTTGPAEGRSGLTAIRVMDDGIGMEPHVLAACRADGYTTRAQSGGTGHGLTMVDWLVHRAGGELHIDSTPGHGTTVTVLLPHPT
jgi:signal transduction histidine kinase